jgi:hypothetical protein
MNFIKIQDYENYSINISGDVRNDKTGRILKKFFNKSNGYYNIDLYKNKIGKHYYIHRLIGLHFIPNPDNKPFIDHIDNNKLNNFIDNLRWASFTENCQNTIKKKNCSSIYKGVSFNKIDKKWRVRIIINKKNIYLGYFDDEKEGAEKYNEYIIENNLTEFFKLNVIL